MNVLNQPRLNVQSHEAELHLVICLIVHTRQQAIMQRMDGNIYSNWRRGHAAEDSLCFLWECFLHFIFGFAAIKGQETESEDTGRNKDLIWNVKMKSCSINNCLPLNRGWEGCVCLMWPFLHRENRLKCNIMVSVWTGRGLLRSSAAV